MSHVALFSILNIFSHNNQLPAAVTKSATAVIDWEFYL
jgi:hypothetical protein